MRKANNTYIISSIIAFGYNSIKIVYQYFTQHPVQATVNFLYWQTQFLSAAKLPVSKNSFELEQCINPIKSLLPFRTTCDRLEDLTLHYEIIKNVQEVADATYIFFTDNHSQVEHRIMAQYFANLLGYSNDYFLVESAGFDTGAPCDELCITQTGSLSTSSNDCIPGTRFNKEFICRGWEDPALMPQLISIKQKQEVIEKQLKELTHNHKEKNIIFDDLKLIYKELQQLTNELTIVKNNINMIKDHSEKFAQALEKLNAMYRGPLRNQLPLQKQSLTALKKHISLLAKTKLTLENHQSYNQLINKIFNIFQEHLTKILPNYLVETNTETDQAYQAISNQMIQLFTEKERLINDDDTIKRNQGLIDTMKHLRLSHNQHAFFLMGMAHGIPDESREGKQKLAKLKSKDPQYPLRKYLETTPSAILIPRFR